MSHDQPSYAPPPPVATRSETTMAGWALGLSVAGFCLCGLAGWVGAALGLVVLFRAADGRDRGNRMAFAAVLLGWLGSALGVVVLVTFAVPMILNGGLDEYVAKDEVQADPRIALPSDVAVGACIASPVIRDPEAATTIRVVPCSAPHDGEVFSSFDLTGSAFPGEKAVDRRAQRRCDRDLARYTADRHHDYQYWYPTARSWASGDRHVLCVLVDPDGKRLEGSRRA